MTDQIQTANRETQVQALTSDELESVTGGAVTSGGMLVALGDGSVRSVDAADYVVWRKTYGAGG